MFLLRSDELSQYEGMPMFVAAYFVVWHCAGRILVVRFANLSRVGVGVFGILLSKDRRGGGCRKKEAYNRCIGDENTTPSGSRGAGAARQ